MGEGEGEQRQNKNGTVWFSATLEKGGFVDQEWKVIRVKILSVVEGGSWHYG